MTSTRPAHPLFVRDEVEFSIVRDKIKSSEVKAVGLRLLGRVLTDKEAAVPEKSEMPQLIPGWMQKAPQAAKPVAESAPITTSSQYPLRPKTTEKLREGLEGLPKEKGIVNSVHEKFGFIKCYGHTELIFYHLNEVEGHRQFEEGDEVEFFLVPGRHSIELMRRRQPHKGEGTQGDQRSLRAANGNLPAQQHRNPGDSNQPDAVQSRQEGGT